MKLTLTLFKIRKSILKTIAILISANKKVPSKNQDFLSLLSIKKEAITISKVSSQLLLIFKVLILVFQI